MAKDWEIARITRTHVRKAALIWQREGWDGFRNSLSYDVVVGGGLYPPKAISSIAHWLATGRKVPSDDFAGAKDGKWHARLRALGFRIQDKDGNDLFDLEVAACLKMTRAERLAAIEKEAGTRPGHVLAQVRRYFRSPCVVAERLRLSEGYCDECRKPSPFTRRNGLPGLEVHHVVPLAEEGADTVENTRALCPNCHSEIHDRLGLAMESD